MQFGSLAAFCLALILAVASSNAWAQATKVVSDFGVNTMKGGAQAGPAAASLNGGGFVVTWTSDRGEPSEGVYGQVYSENGMRRGSEFRVNATTRGQQMMPAVAGLNNKNGGFVVVWISTHLGKEKENIVGRRFNASGAPLGDEFMVNAPSAKHHHWSPAVAALENGGFVVVWYSYPDDTRVSDAFGQLYDAAGRPVGENFHLAVRTDPPNPLIPADSQRYPVVAGLSDGGFIVAWSIIHGREDGEYDFYIMGRRYNAAGAPGTAFNITKRNSMTGQARVSALKNGGFVVSYVRSNLFLDRVFGQAYNAKAEPVGQAFQAASGVKKGKTNATVAGLRDGSFVLLWTHTPGLIHSPNVYAERYNSRAQRVGTFFQINGRGDTSSPSVAGLQNGNFIVTWTALEGKTFLDVLGAIFKPNAAASGG